MVLFRSLWQLELFLSWTLEGIFELTQCLSRALNLSLHVAFGTSAEKQGHGQVCRDNRRGSMALLLKNNC